MGLCPFSDFIFSVHSLRQTGSVSFVVRIRFHQLDGPNKSLSDVRLKLEVQFLHFSEEKSFAGSCVVGLQMIQCNGLHIKLTAAAGGNVLMMCQQSFQMTFYKNFHMIFQHVDPSFLKAALYGHNFVHLHNVFCFGYVL